MISAKNINKSFGDKTVLDNLDWHVPHAGIHAIIGKNGAGKTTFFRLLVGLDSPDKGTIVMQDDSQKQLKVGYLPTDMYFYPRILGKEYLTFCLHAKKLPIEHFDRFNPIFELPLNEQVQTYSSGMKKKLGIMGLLLQENDVLLMDEPYNGLDIENVMLVGKLLEKLAEIGKTIILSSHIFSSITDITSSIFYLKNGAIEDYSNKDASLLKDELLDSKKLKLIQSLSFDS